MIFSIIAAIDKNNGIGFKNTIPWYLPEDFKYFKETTLNKIVLMGMNTYFSLPKNFRPLSQRDNIVICDNIEKSKIIEEEGAKTFSNLEDAINYCGEKECFVIGGASIYNQFIDKCDKLYLTKIDEEFQCDTFFPKVDMNIWEETSCSSIKIDEKNKLKYTFNVYEKKNK